MLARAKFNVGQAIRHRIFSYRGVVVDVDPGFRRTEEWYELMARSRPPKDEPWYHVLVHDAEHWTYVAEQNLEGDDSNEPIKHPDLEQVFSEVRDGVYTRRRGVN